MSKSNRKSGVAKKPKILIGVPANRDLPKQVVAYLLPLVMQVGIENIIFMQNAMINQCRDAIVIKAFEGNYDYIFWVDDDMLIPSDAITKLLSHNKDICSGLYFSRGNYKPLLYNIEYFKDEDQYGYTQLLDYPQNSLIKVGGVGFGCCLTKVSALRKIWEGNIRGATGTCFDFIGGIGEDLSFAIRGYEMDIETWVDTSVKCGHIGQYTVTEEAWLAVKNLNK